MDYVVPVMKPVTSTPRVYRAQFSALTAHDVQKALQHLRMPNRNESLSVDARRELDLRIGCAVHQLSDNVSREKIWPGGPENEYNSLLVRWHFASWSFSTWDSVFVVCIDWLIDRSSDRLIDRVNACFDWLICHLVIDSHLKHLRHSIPSHVHWLYWFRSGPCQTPTLGFCVERHMAITHFQPEPYFQIRLEVELPPVPGMSWHENFWLCKCSLHVFVQFWRRQWIMERHLTALFVYVR